MRVMAIAVALPAADTTFATFIGDIDGNTITATGTNTLPYGPASALLDGSGMIDLTNGRVAMSAKAYQTNWLTAWLADYRGAYGTNGSILFTFAENTSPEQMLIWNLSSAESTNAYSRGVRAVTISYSTGTNPSGTGTTIFSGNLAQATWSRTYAGTGYQNNITGLTAQNVKAVKIAYTSNYGSNDSIGMSEVRFVGMIVPEPATLILLDVGLLGLRPRRPGRSTALSSRR